MSWISFLKIVLTASLTSIGGTEAHFGVFTQLFVIKKKLIHQQALQDYISLFSLVPGPTSTQTITAIGYQIGGPILALLSVVVWTTPTIIMMTILGLFTAFFISSSFVQNLILLLPALAIALMTFAAYTLAKKSLYTLFDWVQLILVLIMLFLFASISFWVIPILLFVSGLFRWFMDKKPETMPVIAVKKYRSLWFIFFLVILIIISEVVSASFTGEFIGMITSIFRYGYGVFGGGQVVVPWMIQDLVNQQQLISADILLAGYAFDQAIPGPLFSFASYVGAHIGSSLNQGFLFAVSAGVTIFIPGTFLVMAVYPFYAAIQSQQGTKNFLKGVSVTVVALVMYTLVNQGQMLANNVLQTILYVVLTILLFTKKVSTLWLVVMMVMISIILSIV
jgi:chromate transporter